MSNLKSTDCDRVPFERNPEADRVYWGLHYERDKKGVWTGSRTGVNCLFTMQSLVKRWKAELDSDGFFCGEIKGNKYPEIPNYSQAKEKYK